MKCCTDKEPIHAHVQGVPVKKMPCQKNCPNCQRRAEEKKHGKLKKAGSVTLMLMLLGFMANAQTPAAQDFWTDPFNSPMLLTYIVMSFLIITVILVFLVALYLKKVVDLMTAEMLKEKALRAGVPYVAPKSWWEKFWQEMNDAVPVSQEQDIDLGHNYDGIRELDNHLPPWWKGLFYGSIIWGAIYLFLYHVVPTFPLSGDEYKKELAVADEKARILKASMPAEAIDEANLTYKEDKDIIGKGQLVFTANNCQSCHRADGGGNTIGPNLTDAYWLHGGDIKNVFGTIKNGVVEKGMPAWGKVMSTADVRNVAFYVMSLQGTNPANAKAPQGQLFEVTKVESADSVKVK